MWLFELKQKYYRKQTNVDFDKLPNIYKKRSEILKIVMENSTPLFIADRQILLDRLESLKKALQKYWGNYKIAYSFKTNYAVAKLNFLKEHGLWAEVVSGREYQMAKKIGFKGNEIIFNGPLKTDDDLRTAFNDGALAFIDNFPELNRILKIARSQKKKFDIGIRINPNISGIRNSRFGLSVDNREAAKALNIIQNNPFLNLVGLHMHIGTDIDSTNSYKEAAKAMANFILGNVKNYESKIKFLDFGGGFPAHGLASYGRIRWNPKPIESYIQTISNELNKIYKVHKPTLILEPGRYLVDDAVFFMTKITNSQK